MTYLVAVYLIDQAYGGPEEGGWWYQVGKLVRVSKVFKNEELTYSFCRKFNNHLEGTLNKERRPISSVLSEGVFCAQVHEDFAPKHYPEVRPHYE